IEREQVGAIRAAERTAVGQLGEQAERLVHHCGTRQRHVAVDPMLLPGMPLPVASCDLRHLIAGGSGQPRVPFAIQACATCPDVELVWTSAVMATLYHTSNSFLSAKPRNNVPTSARILSRGAA